MYGYRTRREAVYIRAKEDFGIAKNRQLLLDKVVTPFMLTCDDDMFYEPDAIEKLYETILSTKVGFVRGNQIDVDDVNLDEGNFVLDADPIDVVHEDILATLGYFCGKSCNVNGWDIGEYGFTGAITLIDVAKAKEISLFDMPPIKSMGEDSVGGRIMAAKFGGRYRPDAIGWHFANPRNPAYTDDMRKYVNHFADTLGKRQGVV